MFTNIFHVVLYQPIFNLFVALYNVAGHDVGIVIFILTLLIRIVLYPLMGASIRAQKGMQEIQPKLEALKKEFKDDQTKLAAATMALYKEHKVNPVTSCLPMVVQLPVLIALYLVMRDALAAHDLGKNLYSFVGNPGTINSVTLGIFNLGAPSIVLALLAGGAQFVQAKAMSRTAAPKTAGEGAKDENMMVAMNRQMLYMMPILTAFIGMRLPAGLTLYWFLSTAFMALQQWFVFRKKATTTPTVV